MNSDLIKNTKAFVTSKFQAELNPNCIYHTLDHTLDVYESTQLLAKEAQISEEDLLVLSTAALLHDIGYVMGPVDHELKGVEIANAFLKEQNCSNEFINHVSQCILATQIGSLSDDPICQLLQDADLNKLASSQYEKVTEKLRKEKNNLCNQKISKKKWRKINLEFLTTHKFKSEAGKKLYSDGKSKNILKMKNTIKKEKSKKEKPRYITDNKNAQTQFKTALRNHIDLSNIADNKANIMISVNALILTVALPFMIERAMQNKLFYIPTIILASISLFSMIFATLATRPISMKGVTTHDDVKQNKSNLFFFGNFFNMEYAQYKSQIKEVVSEHSKLDDAIITDLFNLGKSLGKKYDYLRHCYNSFMYGILALVVSLFVVFILSN